MLRQHARYRVLLTRVYQAQQGGALVESRPGAWQQAQARAASSGGKRDDESFIPRMLKG
jgi:hypothetical protein